MKINRELCDICGSCVAVCPVDAISVSEFCVTINQEKCIECGNCQQVCPAKAIGGVNK
jgi:NAD-dependent dihydropyrimidine dehydrogenase PreA subunit